MGKDKGKERETFPRTTPPVPESTATRARPREPDPVWDIELDLNFDNSPESGPPPVSGQSAEITSTDIGRADSTRRIRSPSPMWDIELDLNGSDEDQPGGFGAAALL